MKIAPLIAIVSLVAAAPSFAASILQGSLDAATGDSTDRLITDNKGALLTSGYAGTGYFSISDAEVSALVGSGSFAQLFNSFTAVTTDNFVTGGTNANGSPIPGFYTSASADFDASLLVGKTAYTFLSNGTGTNPTLNGDQFGLISFNLGVVADPTAPPISLAYNALADKGTLLFGTIGGTTNSAELGFGATTIQLQPIPETSTAILGLLGVVGLVRRRR